MEGINELKEHVEKLKTLLDDPHPGLITWMMTVHTEIEEIAEFL